MNNSALLSITPLTRTIGAVLEGVDLSKPLSKQQVSNIWAALLQWRAIFFRDQPLSNQQHLELSRQFGELTAAHPVHGPVDPEFPQIYTVDNTRKKQRYRGTRTYYPWSGWHTDLTPLLNPPAVSILRADAVPAFGDTHWADLVAAYSALSPALRCFVDNLKGVHSFNSNKNLFVTEHPLVRVHPETGERALYVSPNFLQSIVGLTSTESDYMLALFKEHATRYEFTVRFKWETASVAMWDNRSTMHLGTKDILDTDPPRMLFRTTLMGDIPSGLDGKLSRSIKGEPLTPCE